MAEYHIILAGGAAVLSVCPNECLQSEITISHKAVSWWIASHKATVLTWPPVPRVSCPVDHSPVISAEDGPSLFSTRESIYLRLRQGFGPGSDAAKHADQLSLQGNNTQWAALRAQPLTEESTLQSDIPGPKGFFSLKAIWKK